MKIVAISSQHSNGDGIALVTEPPLTAQIFEEAGRQVSSAAMQALSLQTTSGCLIVHSARFDPELRATLEHLLTEAEGVVSGVAARKQAEAEQFEKEITLESAAAGFGLPIV
jgi:hypothetical protein